MGPWFSGRTVLSHGTSGGPIPLGSKIKVSLWTEFSVCRLICQLADFKPSNLTDFPTE